MPFQAAGAVKPVAALAIEPQCLSLHVAQSAGLCAYVAVASQRHLVALDADDAMQYEVSFGYLGQNSIALMTGCCRD